MRVILIIATLLLAACGKKNEDQAPPTCTKYASAYEILYHDQVFRKSDVWNCESYYHAESVDNAARIENAVLIVRLTHVDDSTTPATVTYQLTEFAGQ